MNNICIDIGNTSSKAGIFINSELAEKKYNLKDLELVKLCNHLSEHKIIVSAVTNQFNHIYNLIENKSRITILDHSIPTPIINKYHSPSTLGTDRLAAAIGAQVRFPDKNLLIIQTGTCFTYDLVTKENEYLGGAISTGLIMRFDALKTFTQKLPLVQMDEKYAEIIGTDTQTSILSGVVNGSVSEIEGMIDKYSEKFENLTVLLTGGWANYFDTKINRSKFAFQDLVLLGLNKILLHNNE